MPPLLLLALFATACHHAPPDGFDAQLPEHVEAVTGRSPLEVLEEGAAALDPTARARALAHLIAHDAAYAPRALGDPSSWVQRAAVAAVGARGDSAAELLALVGRTSADPFVRALAALEAGSAAAEPSRLAQADAAEPWQVAPLALAALVLGDETARDALSAALQTGELALEVDLFFEIGRTDDAALLPALEQAQRRVEAELVLPVATARMMLGDASAEQAFRKAVTGSDVEARLEALDYLTRLYTPEANALLRRARTQGPELVTWYANLALAARAGTDPELFGRALRDTDREVRVLAVRFSREAASGGPANRRVAKAARKAVLDALADRDSTVRIEALRAVAALDLPEARQVVEALVDDERPLVRIEAAGTVLQLTR